MSEHEMDYPITLNPEAVGDPNQTPIVQLPPAMVAFFERTRCPECRQINQTHASDCPTTQRRAHYLRGDDCSCGFAAGLGATCKCAANPPATPDVDAAGASERGGHRG